MLRTRRLPALAAALALTLAPLAACGGDSATEAILKNSDESIKDVDIDGDSATIETDDGKMSIGGDTEVPDEFPSDVPLPEADHNVGMSTVTSKGVSFSLTVPDLDVASETARMVPELEGAGWEVEKTEMNSGSSRMTVLVGNKEDLQLNLTLMRDGDEDGVAMYGVTYTAD